MLAYADIIGNQEDWANFITNVEMEDAPFLNWLPSGDKPVNVLYDYQAEKYADPVVNTHVDGTPVTGFLSAGDSRGKLISLIQYFTKAAAVSKLHQEVSDIAGVDDELARDIEKRTWELSTDFESAFLGNGDHIEDNGTVGYMTRGVDSWVQVAAQTLYPVPADFRTPTAQISTVATGSITENTFLDVFQAIGQTMKGSRGLTAFLGPAAKRAFNAFPLFTPASTLIGGTPTGASGVVYNKGDVNVVGRVVERYQTDYGTVELRLSWRNLQFETVAITRNYTSFFLHRDMWQLRWNQKPQWMRKAYEGGSHEAFCEAIAMLVCKNPKAEGKWKPAT